MLNVKTRNESELFLTGFDHPTTALSTDAIITYLASYLNEQLDQLIIDLPQKVYVGEAEYMMLAPIARIAHIQAGHIMSGAASANLLEFTVSNEMQALAVRFNAIAEVINYFQTRELAREITPQMLETTPIYQQIYAVSLTTPGNPAAVNNGLIAQGLVNMLNSTATSAPTQAQVATAVYEAILPLLGNGAAVLNPGTIQGLYTMLLTRMKQGSGLPITSQQGKTTWARIVTEVITNIRSMIHTTTVYSAGQPQHAGLFAIMEAAVLFLALKGYLDAIRDYSTNFPRSPIATYTQAWALSARTYAKRMQRTWASFAAAPYAFFLELDRLTMADAEQWLKPFLEPELLAIAEARQVVESLSSKVMPLLPKSPLKDLASQALDAQKTIHHVDLLIPQAWMASYMPFLNLAADDPSLWDTGPWPMAGAPFLVSHSAIANGRAMARLALPSSRAILDRQQRPIASAWMIQSLSDYELALSSVQTSLTLALGLDEDTASLAPIVPMEMDERAAQRTQVTANADAPYITFSRPTSLWAREKYVLTDTGSEDTQVPGGMTEPVNLEVIDDTPIQYHAARVTPRWIMSPYLYQPFGLRRSYVSLRFPPEHSLFVWNSKVQDTYPCDAAARPFLPSPVPACYTLTRNRSYKNWNFKNYLRKLSDANPDVPEMDILPRLAEWLHIYQNDTAVIESITTAVAGTMFIYRISGNHMDLLHTPIPTIYGVPTNAFISRNAVAVADVPQLIDRDRARRITVRGEADYVFVMHTFFPKEGPMSYIPYVTEAGVIHAAPLLLDIYHTIMNNNPNAGAATTAMYEAADMQYFSDLGNDIVETVRNFNQDTATEWYGVTGMSPSTMIVPHLYFDAWTQPVIDEGEDHNVERTLITSLVRREDKATGSIVIRLRSNEEIVMIDYEDETKAYAALDPEPAGLPKAIDVNDMDMGVKETLTPTDAPPANARPVVSTVLATDNTTREASAADTLPTSRLTVTTGDSGQERVDVTTAGPAANQRSHQDQFAPASGDPDENPDPASGIRSEPKGRNNLEDQAGAIQKKEGEQADAGSHEPSGRVERASRNDKKRPAKSKVKKDDVDSSDEQQ